MPSHLPAETIESHGCRVVLRRVEGPRARELYLHAEPVDAGPELRRQAESLYRAALEALASAGASAASVVTETCFLDDVGEAGSVRAARRAVLGAAHCEPASTRVGQPPLDDRARLEISLQAIVPSEAPLRATSVEVEGARGLRVELGDEIRLYAAGLHGAGEGAYQQVRSAFEVAGSLLEHAGMSFPDVARTWLHFPDIDRDYEDLNRARRPFFERLALDPIPASTGIGGGLAGRHDVGLGLYALRSPSPSRRIAMSAPTLNEAPQYGADFVRGLRVEEANKIALHVSGTASVDESGHTAHPGDVAAQAERMLINVTALLEGQGAGVGDVVSAITYVKRREDAALVRRKLGDAGFGGFPHAWVEADVCRPDLLCETEALAVLPKQATSAG